VKTLVQKFVQFLRNIFNPKKENTTTMSTINTILIKPRRASVLQRRTQVQIPLALYYGYIFPATTITNRFGEVRKVVRAHARGRVNTVKIEVPEIAYMPDPVLRFTLTPNGVVYEAFDSFLGAGHSIMNTLRVGLTTKKTVVTLPRREERATWYMLVAA
jgi:hypothetical protein